MTTPSRRNRALALAFVAGASVAMHLKGISSPLLDLHAQRQCQTAAIARNYHENGLRFFHPQIDWNGADAGRAATEFPLFMWLTGLFWPLAGLAELWGRILASAFSALTAVYLFLLVEEDCGREAALFAATLFSFMPLEIYFGRTVQPEALALCATVAALYHWRRSLENSPAWGHWAAAVAAAFLAVSHKLPYAFLFAPMAWLSWRKLGRQALKDPQQLAGILLPVLGTLAWYRYAASGSYVVPTKAREFLGMLDYDRRLLYYLQFQFISRFPELTTTHMGLPLLAVGIFALPRPSRSFYAVWFGAVALSLAVYGGYSFYHEYTSLPLVPVNAALMGAGLDFLRRKASGLSRARAWALAGLALLVLAIPIYSVARIGHWYKINQPFLLQARQAADQVSSPDDLFVCGERSPVAFLFYMRRKGWGVNFWDKGPQELKAVAQRMGKGARFFAAEKSGPFQDQNSEIARWFYSRFPVAWDRDGFLIFRLRT